MPFSLTQKDILAVCTRTYYNRGWAYQEQGRVESLEWYEHEQAIFSEVAGSRRNIYQQEISFSKPGSGKLFTGYCSCPVGLNCKHVAAVLLEWLKQHQHTQQDGDAGFSALQMWQAETSQQLASESSPEYPGPGQPCLLHLLQPFGHNSTQAFSLQTLKSRRLKKGGWGKTSQYYLSQISNLYYVTPEVVPLDIEIAQLLASESYAHELPTLKGDIGVLVLFRLLRSGRCFYQSTENPPLTLGPKRAASFQWHEDDQGETRLDVSLDGIKHAWIPIPTTPPWYLDPETHQCGAIDQPLPSTLFHSLNKLPPIASKQLNEFSHYLLQQLPANSIPLPVELNIKICNLPPIPTLILHAIVDTTGRRYHLARIRHGYGPISLPPMRTAEAESCLIHHADEDWQIHRQPDMEKIQLDRLFDFGLRLAPTSLAHQKECELYFITDTLAESALAWKQFIDQIPLLEAEGWNIEIDDSYRLSFETVEDLHADIRDEQDSDNIDDDDEAGKNNSYGGWFEIGLNIEHGGHRFPLLPLLIQWLKNKKPDQPLLVQLEDSRWLEIPPSVLEPVVGTLVELSQEPQLTAAGQLKLARPQAHELLALEAELLKGGHNFNWQGGKKLRQLAEKLNDFQGIEVAPIPTGFKAELRNYQQQGLSWLQFLCEYGFNGILADDMGLGKTIQTLAHLLLEKETGRLTKPVLIVAPTSVISNWKRESDRFSPDLKCLILHGPARAIYFDKLHEYDLIITSYALLTRDLEKHLKHHYHSLILDEAQAIKNPLAKSAQAARKIKAAHRLCLTGTPMENHLGELWSLFHFLMPGFLGNQKKFNQLFRTPIEKHRDQARQEQLQDRLAPFVLRRNKSQVVMELPPKTLIIREVELNGPQAKLYESLRIAMTDRIDKLLKAQGLKNSHIHILDALLKLRQVCCDPRLVKLESARKVKHSAKFDLLFEMLEELLEEGRKILIFSQFTSMLSLIEEELMIRNIDYSKLTGRTRKRDEAIATFQDGKVPLFLISLKAGGVGLNLTAADTVIHYDPWWNPAVENQATDRAHRIGQEKPVFVYKLVASGTVEEKILQLQQKKQNLADSMYKQTDKSEEMPGINSEEILSLLEPFE